MTDRETIVAMLVRAGIVIRNDDSDCVEVHVEDQVGRKRSGYGGFFTEFQFNGDGSLDRVAAWE